MEVILQRQNQRGSWPGDTEQLPLPPPPLPSHEGQEDGESSLQWLASGNRRLEPSQKS